MIEIFDVDPDGTRPEDALHHRHDLPRRRSEPADDVRAERHRKGSGNPLGGQHECLAVNDLPVRIAEGDHDAGARCRDGRETFILENAGTGDIPCVRQDEQLLALMQLPECLRLFSLVLHAHRPLRSGSWTMGSHADSRQDAPIPFLPKSLGHDYPVHEPLRPPTRIQGTTCNTTLPRLWPRRPRSYASRARARGKTASTIGRTRPASISSAI